MSKRNSGNLMSKLQKLIKHPGVFFRDYFNKRYPVINNEQLCPEKDEALLIKQTEKLEQKVFADQKSIDVDVVYTWINKNEQWEREFKAVRDSKEEVQFGRYALDDARFEDHDELYYSLKSVRKFMPWVRQVFIVTNNTLNLPEYLDSNDITVITHAEIISEEYLPTFNSHVIEAHLHNIPELSENFIYFNDDVFAARPLTVGHFFQENGLASLFLSQKFLDQLYIKGNHTPTLQASLYSQALIEREFSKRPNQALVHTYVPLKKSMYQIAWDLYQAEIEAFLNNQFRGSPDLNLATFLVPWLMYLHGCSFLSTDICYYFNIRSAHAIQQYKKLLSKDEDSPHSICANDFFASGSDDSKQKYQDAFSQFLNKFFKIEH